MSNNYGFLEGNYHTSTEVNGKPSWVNDAYAIWYISSHDMWILGNLNDIGQFSPIFWSFNDFSELTVDNEWRFWNGASWTISSYISIVLTGSFKDFIEKCLLAEPKVNMTHLMETFINDSPRQSHVFAKLIKDRKILDGWDEMEDQSWTNIFHPELGYCHTFNLRQVKNLSLDFDSYYEIIFNTLKPKDTYYHEENVLFDPAKTQKTGRQWIRAKLVKRIITLPEPPLTRLPCFQDDYLTCEDKNFHSILAKKHSCIVPILYSGNHLSDVIDESLPECNGNVTSEVSLMKKKFLTTPT